MENGEKKRYLNTYKEAIKNITRIDESISELRRMKMYPTAVNDGMPHGNRFSDFSEYVAKLDEMENDLRKSRYQQLVLFEELRNKIEKLDNEIEKDILFYRYIKLNTWEEICTRIGYGWSRVHEIHNKALRNFIL